MKSLEFYPAVIRHLFSCAVVPTPQEFARWLSAQQFVDAPAELNVWIERLVRWPANQPYPPIPDDETLAHGSSDRRWWTPGARPSSQVKNARRAIAHILNP